MRAFGMLFAMIAAIAVGTLLAGWWTVPIVAGLWTYAFPRRAAVIYAACAGAGAWGALLLWYGRRAPIGELDALLAAVMGVPNRSVLLLTLAFAALLSGAAALVAQSIRPPQRRA